MPDEISTVGVVGLGTMGAGIVEVFARNGIDVVAVEVSEAVTERGRATLPGSTDRAVAKGKLTAADRDALLGRVRFAVGLDALADVDLVIEAVPEQPRPQADRSSPSSTGSVNRRRSSPPTPRRCRSPRSRSRPSARTGWSACTSSTRPRS